MQRPEEREVSRKVQQLVAAGEVTIARRHIESERQWREIRVEHVEHVLNRGKLRRVSGSDIRWRGTDQDGRLLELICELQTEGGDEVLTVSDAKLIHVGTAYHAEIDDEALLEQWLRDNPDFERVPGRKKAVQRKIAVTYRKQ